ncbi:hypothetical protein [Azospirillum largimobile]
MTSTNLMGPPGKAAPTADPLSATLDVLEVQLFNTTPTPQPMPVTETSSLVPIVTANLMVWQHRVDDDHVLCALGAIAEALDDAHFLVVAARLAAPRPWQPLVVQCNGYTLMRRHLTDAAEILEWAMTVARSVSLTMTINIEQSIRRDEEGQAVTVSTATLSLRE